MLLCSKNLLTIVRICELSAYAMYSLLGVISGNGPGVEFYDSRMCANYKCQVVQLAIFSNPI